MKSNQLINLELHLETTISQSIKDFTIEILEVCAMSNEAGHIIKTSESLEAKFIETNQRKLKELFTPLLQEIAIQTQTHIFSPLQEALISEIGSKFPFFSMDKFLQYLTGKGSKGKSKKSQSIALTFYLKNAIKRLQHHNFNFLLDEIK
jgi:hypothetical protein